MLRLPTLIEAPVLPPTAVPAFMALWLLAAVAFTVGLRTRVAGATLTGMAVYLLVLDRQMYSNHLYLLALLSFLLTVAWSGGALSVDALRRGEAGSVDGWPVTLLKIQVSVVYGFAAVSKVNVAFLSGTVIAMYIRDGPLSLPESWRIFPVLYVLSLVAVAAEAFLAVALWVPGLRAAAFSVGFLLHLGMVILLRPPYQLAVFALETLALYVLFVGARPGSRVVVWDDSCSFCAGWVRWFRRLDWLAVHRYVGLSDAARYAGTGVTLEEASQALQLIDDQGRASGFDAVRGVLERLPISFLWAPLLGIGPIRRLGSRLYARVAERRRCRLGHPGSLPARTAPASLEEAHR